MINWADCDVVERTPDKVSGAWLVKGTRIRVDDILANADSTPEQIVTEIYPTLRLRYPTDALERVERIIDYAKRHSGPPCTPR
jgi:uncharacterized protein (DUF433 family)